MTLRILEIGDAGAAAYCGRLFAMAAARVTRIDAARADPGIGAAARARDLYLNAGKERVTLDLTIGEGRARVAELAANADLLVIDESPRAFAALGCEALLAQWPALHVISITPFGLDGPCRDWEGGSPVLLAMGGYSHLIGDADGAPLTLPGQYASYQAGQYAYTASLAHLYGTARHSAPRQRLFDVSMLETVLSLSQFTTVMWTCQGAVRGRSGFSWTSFSCVGLYPCKDGWVGINALPQFWDAFLLMLDRPELALDPRFTTNQTRLAHRAELDAIIADAFRDRTMDELLELGQRVHRVPCGSMYDMQRILDDEHLAVRGFWNRIPGPAGTRLAAPSLPWHIPRQSRGGALGAVQSRKSAPGRTEEGLAGVRILDLTHVWAGPLATRILADLGADVVKVESPFIRGPAEVAPGLLGLQIDAPDEPHHWNKNGLFNKLNRNKRGLCINLKLDEGRQLFLDLVAEADVVIENFSATAMQRLGVGYEVLRTVNDRILYLSMPGYGTYGPQSDFVAYGPSVEPMTGLVSLLGYAEGQNRPTNIALPDAAGGVAAAAAIVTALHRRLTHAPGGPIDLSMQEAMICLLGEFLVERQLTGKQPAVQGNANPAAEFEGTYPCRGQDAWIVLSCQTRAQWQKLCGVSGRPWDTDARFATREGRSANRALLDAAIGEWTRGEDKRALMTRLQESGVPAGAVMTAPEFMEDPQVVARDYFRTVPGANMGRIRLPGLPVVSGARREAGWGPAPRLGEHNRAVLTEWLGMETSAIERLEDLRVLATRPPH